MTTDVPPPWADCVPRWQQMDPVARAVADAWYERFGIGPAGAPAQLVLALPAASNQADVEFAATGAYRPQKFVATLPSVVAAPVLQLTGGIFPVLCIQDGVRTLDTARAEAELLARAGAGVIGLLSVTPDLVVDYQEVRA